MKDAVFLVYCQLLTVLIVGSYGAFRVYFGQDPNSAVQVHLLKNQLKQESLKTELVLEDLDEFKALVATYLPEALKNRGKKQEGYPLRTLASLATQFHDETLKQGLAEAQFQKAKQYFRTADYVGAKKAFAEYLEKHPYSTNIIEANFLLMEATSQLGERENSTKIIEKMVAQFPDSELTGFALLKLGGYLQDQGRNLEASQIYRTILQSFPYHDVAMAASKSMRSLEP